MKKLALVLAAVFAMAMTASAQDNIGVRLGGGQGYNTELSWQHGLGGNRLELDLGWHNGDHHSDLSLTGIYQWTGTISGNFGWFAGVGGHLGYWSWENGYEGDGNIALAVAGQAGLEYAFQAVPIQLSLDIRPRLYFIPDGLNFHWGDIALGIRWMF